MRRSGDDEHVANLGRRAAIGLALATGKEPKRVCGPSSVMNSHDWHAMHHLDYARPCPGKAMSMSTSMSILSLPSRAVIAAGVCLLFSATRRQRAVGPVKADSRRRQAVGHAQAPHRPGAFRRRCARRGAHRRAQGAGRTACSGRRDRRHQHGIDRRGLLCHRVPGVRDGSGDQDDQRPRSSSPTSRRAPTRRCGRRPTTSRPTWSRNSASARTASCCRRASLPASRSRASCASSCRSPMYAASTSCRSRSARSPPTSAPARWSC